MKNLNSQKNVFVAVGIAVLVLAGIMIFRNAQDVEVAPAPTIESEVAKMAQAYAMAQNAYRQELEEYSTNPGDIGAMLTDDETRILLVMQESDIPEWVKGKLPSDAIPSLNKDNYRILILNQEQQNQFWVSDQSGEIILSGDVN